VSRALALPLLLVAACASPRFLDQPVVWKVSDSRSIREPAERKYNAYEYFARVLLFRRIDRAMELRRHELAGNTNALDEVPDSSWFQNRIGRQTLTPEEIATGPGASGPPVLPWKAVKAKEAGGNPGFIAEDQNGRKYLVKFDTLENPEMQTAAAIVGNRVFWALGFNVPSDHIVTFRPEELEVPEKARAAIDAVLKTSPKTADGAYRSLASEMLAGVPKGGFASEGLRGDDPNDRVPHERRRELRGLRVFAAWLSHTDMKEDNTLDMYVEEDGRKFIKHYLVDFGEALGGHAAEKGRKEDGWEHVWDWDYQTRAFFSFGLWTRPWESLEPSPYPAIGYFSAKGFNPLRWREAYPYFPFFETDDADAYWAAKLVMRFDRPALEAIVGQAQLSDPAAAAYLVEALIGRRDIIGRSYLDAVTPFDEFETVGTELCGVDLSTKYGFSKDAILEQKSRGTKFVPIPAGGRACLPLPTEPGYVVWRVRIRRPLTGKQTPWMQLHFRNGVLRGIIRH
jgi:hypothetical protein